MRRAVIFLTAGCLYCCIIVSCTSPGKLIKESDYSFVFDRAKQQYRGMLQQITDTALMPRTSTPDGQLKQVPITDWTAGFWPGCLWFLYEQSSNNEWRDAALRRTQKMEPSQYFTNNHDIGFMMYNSYGNAWRLTGDSSYLPVLIQSARSLCKRYSPEVRSIRSWNPRKSIGGKNDWQYPVIIDNMMNLELLFFASGKTGDATFRNIAIAHAETAMKNQLRADNSIYHVVDYDSLNGSVRYRQTAQGFSDSSAWARGQAWGIYGFTMVYRYTKDPRFLITAMKLADFFLSHPNLPADMIPLWDFNVPDYAADKKKFHPDWAYDPGKYPVIPRDASAAAITASALIELADYSDGNRKRYLKAAEKILSSLAGPEYLAKENTNNHFLLMHSTGNLPGNNEVDVPLIYADYYFLEALLRYSRRSTEN